MSGILGKKIGMTSIFDELGHVVPVTVIEAGPCYVTQVRTGENDGYDAIQLGFGVKKEKRVKKPLAGHVKKANVAAPQKLKEFSGFEGKELNPGDEVKVDIFKPGDMVKIAGTSKGRGFTGVVKRHNFGGGPVTHGQSDRLRAPGSLGQSSDPSRVYKGLKMAGQMGNKRLTVKNLRVIKVDPEKNLLFVRGAVPGARNSYVEIYHGKES
ncbi:MAG: 50S ribosomal protein L3 [Calditrichaeota bacterium]|nr:50S ribosomal protein L3 [Calditrichota bacterium]RQV92349.1 MAG: 50S ribosomal protein L3 [bacterium]RQV98692.1 MAG: 50S ribosomal protein L3 [Calditrichota bacterium]